MSCTYFWLKRGPIISLFSYFWEFWEAEEQYVILYLFCGIVKLAEKDGKDLLYQIFGVKLGVRLIRGCDLYAEFYGAGWKLVEHEKQQTDFQHPLSTSTTVGLGPSQPSDTQHFQENTCLHSQFPTREESFVGNDQLRPKNTRTSQHHVKSFQQINLTWWPKE